MSTSNNNYSILPWYDSQNRQQHRKSYARGQVFPLICGLYYLPCFQIFRTSSLMSEITEFKVIKIETGVEIDILAAANATGLNIQSFSPPDIPNYDLIIYPGQTPLVDVVLSEGQYEARISDGDNTWYSERFFMKEDLSRFIKLKYWHETPFPVPLHHISYADPFYSFVYLDSEINRPEYEEEEDVELRDGYRFPIYQVSKKAFRIVGLALPEYMCDALRLVWMHHHVIIEWDDIIYVVDDIRVIFEEWVNQGHLCGVTIEFHTDSVATQTGYTNDESYGGDYDQTDYNDDHLIS